jgi:hypothetical protein
MYFYRYRYWTMFYKRRRVDMRKKMEWVVPQTNILERITVTATFNVKICFYFFGELVVGLSSRQSAHIVLYLG